MSIQSSAGLRSMAEAAGLDEPLDGRRFRMTFTVDGVEAHAEDGWLGRPVRIGEAVVRPGGNIGRCAVTTQDPDTGIRSLDTLQAAGRDAGPPADHRAAAVRGLGRGPRAGPRPHRRSPWSRCRPAGPGRDPVVTGLAPVAGVLLGAIALLAGYLVGSLPAAPRIARMAGVDLAGATAMAAGGGTAAVWRLAGPGWGFLALTADLAKGVVPVAIGDRDVLVGDRLGRGPRGGAGRGLAGVRPRGRRPRPGHVRWAPRSRSRRRPGR